LAPAAGIIHSAAYYEVMYQITLDISSNTKEGDLHVPLSFYPVFSEISILSDSAFHIETNYPTDIYKTHGKNIYHIIIKNAFCNPLASSKQGY